MILYFNINIRKCLSGGSEKLGSRKNKTIQCPLDYGLKVFGSRWKSRIIWILSKKQVLRYSELHKEIPDISDTLLTSNLKELIQDDIVKRRQFIEIPPRVEYSLSKKGETVIPILNSIWKWANKYCKENTLQE